MRFFFNFTLLIPLCTYFVQGQTLSTEVFQAANHGESKVAKKVLYVDDDNFLWYPTQRGIIKECGGTKLFFELSNPMDSRGEPSVNQILKSKENFLWVATSHGAYSIDLNTGKGEWIIPKIPGSSNIIDFYSIFEDGEGNIWFGTELDYIFKVSHQYGVTPIKLMESQYIRIRQIMGTGSINSRIKFEGLLRKKQLIVSQGNTLFLIDLNTFEQEKVETIENYNITDTNKEWILVKESPYFNKRIGIGRYFMDGNKYFYSYISKIDAYFVEVPLGTKFIPRNKNHIPAHFLWYDHTGMKFYNISKDMEKNNLSMTNSLPFDHAITNFTVDNKGTIWIHTQDGAITMVQQRGSYFTTYLSNEKTKISCRSMSENSNGEILVFSHNGFYIRSKGKVKFDKLDILNPDIVNSLYGFYAENDSIIWAYGYSPYLYRINIHKDSYTKFSFENKMSSLSRRTIYKDAVLYGRSLFLAANIGLHKFNLDTHEFSDESKLNEQIDISGLELKSMFLDQDQSSLWIGSTKGVYEKNLKNDSVRYLNENTKPLKLTGNEVNVIYRDANSHIWLGTNTGLQKIDTKNWTTEIYSEQYPFNTNKITGILGNKDTLWIGTFDGLVQFISTNGMAQAFYNEDGLTNSEFNFKSFLKTTNGEFLFGGIDGIASFYPREIQKEIEKPRLVLNQYSIFDKKSRSIRNHHYNTTHVSTFVLPYDYNYLSLDFSINDIFNRNKNKYQYRLGGMDSDWMDAGSNGILQLQRLTPGVYSLEVRGISSKGIHTNILKYSIVSKEAFYKSKEFIILGMTVVFGFIALWYINRNKYIKNQHNLKKKIFQLEAKALRTQMNPHFLYNAINGVQCVMFLKGEYEANKYITSLSKLLRFTLDQSNEGNITLKEEIDYLISYIDVVNIRRAKKVHVSFKIDDSLDTTNITLPIMLFQPIVENAIIHGFKNESSNNRLIISFTKKEHFLIVTISDNGVGRKISQEHSLSENNAKKSWATYILNERINIINTTNKRKIHVETIDLFENGEASGTKVEFLIPI